MKNFILLAGFILISTFALQAQTSTKIKVAGNCGMCKAHIEKAAKEAGAVTANWDKAAKVLKVSFDASKTSTDKIEDAVAAAGYDTEHKVATADAYGKLDECCQYDRTSKTAVAENASCCKPGASCCADGVVCKKGMSKDGKEMECCKKDAKCCKDGSCCK
jgi:mercuric ion binding protein